MNQPIIPFKISGKVYKLSATDGQALRKIPKADRQQLILLLEALKKQDAFADAADQATEPAPQTTPEATVADANTQAASNTPKNQATPAATSPQTQQNKPSEEKLLPIQRQASDKMGSGDVDAVMSRLIMQQKQEEKPGLSKQSLYIYLGAFTVLVIIGIISFS